MKTCGFCGAPNNDDNQFCIGCGKKMETDRPVSPADSFSPPAPPVPPSYADVPPMQQPPYPPAQPPVNPGAHAPYFYGQPAGFYGNGPVMQDTGRMERVRDVLSSGLMLTIVIVWFAQVVVTVMTAMFGTSGLSNILADAGMSGIEIDALSSLMSGITAAGILPSLIPSILIGIGLLTTYRSAKASSLKSSGITMIRVIFIIQFVFGCIGIAALFILGIVFLSGGAYEILNELFSLLGVTFEYDEIGDLLSFFGVFIFIAAIFTGAIMIGFYIILFKFIGSVRETINTGIAREKCASALSVILFVLGGFSAISIFGTLGTVMLEPVLGLISFGTYVVTAVLYFTLGVLINKYKQAVYS